MIERIQDERIAEIVSLVLAEPGGRAASRQQVATYRAYLQRVRMRHVGFRMVEQRQCRGAVLALLLPGRTVVLMIPPAGEVGTTLASQTEVTRQAAAELEQDRPYFLQALVEPYCAAKQVVFQAAGFEFLTRLQYLEAAVSDSGGSADEFSWVSYNEERCKQFEELVARTYVGSLDCPELTRLRPESDALAAHQASGEFEPALWEICKRGGAEAGCVLCAPLPDAKALEVVYMGVVPEARGMGIARRLLRRAAQHATARRLARLLLVVDERNAPARRLYEQHGFRCTSVRDAYLRAAR